MINGVLLKNGLSTHDEINIMKDLFKDKNRYEIEGPYTIPDNKTIPCEYNCNQYYVAQFYFISPESEAEN